ncbi:glycosyltransferase [Curtobacterium sp. SGAir0471]|uniref:glycosyltransferase n=1 Tax=Curtobacterium sp. SGAir0471 TaxID=2070337 RepID=UPI00158691B9|nr:glycosyltransferase [Curtobacterium sp. SGAir0471]
MSSYIFVQPHLRFGGAERQTVNVANRLAENGHRVTVILHSGGGGLVPLLRPNVAVLVLGVESHAATVDVARRLHAVLRALPRSLVIVKLWSSILACAMIDRSRSVAHHVFNYCEDLDPTDHAEYIRFGRLKQRLIGSVFRARPLLSANTHTVADAMTDVYGLDHRPAVIPSTVDPVAIRSAAAASPCERDDAFTVVSVGSLIRRKGLDVTLAALEGLGVPVHWRVVGAGPLSDELARYRDPRGLLRVSVEGAHAEPYSFIAAADVLVHSARSEAWGIVLLEALAVGTPVLAASTIGPSEMQSLLGVRNDLLELFENGSAADLQARLRARLHTPRPALDDCDAYIEPVTLNHAVTRWERRAHDLLESPA